MTLPLRRTSVDPQLLDTLKASATFLYKQGVGAGAAAVDEAVRLLSRTTERDALERIRLHGSPWWRDEWGTPASIATDAFNGGDK